MFRSLLTAFTLLQCWPISAAHNFRVSHNVQELNWFQVRSGPRPNCALPSGLKMRYNVKESYDNLYDQNKPFTFIRWGDGDLFCAMGFGSSGDINGDSFVNGPMAEVCTRRQQEMLEYGKEENLFVIMGDWFICKETHPDTYRHVDHFLSQHPMRTDFNGWVGDQFYFELYRQDMKPTPGITSLLPRLVGRKVVVVGPAFLQKLKKHLGYVGFITAENAASRLEEIKGLMRHESSTRPAINVIFLVSAGTSTRTLLYDMWKELGQKDTFIDTGSSLDGFAGVHSRDYNSDTASLCRRLPQFMAEGLCSGTES